MKKSQKILFGVLCVFALAAILGITWMTASRVTSAQIYEELQAMPVTNKTSEISAYLDRFFIDDYDEETARRCGGKRDGHGDGRPLELLSERLGIRDLQGDHEQCLRRHRHYDYC